MIWPIKKLGEVCEINMGQSPASSTYNDNRDGLPFYQGKKDYGEKYPTPRIWCSEPIKIVDTGDILISVRAPVSALNIAKEKTCIGRGLAGLRGKSNLDQNYLFHFLKLKEKEIAALGTGSTFTAISKKHLENLEIPLPPLAEQKRIVAKLERVLAKISEAKKLRAEARENADNLLPAELHKIFKEGKRKGWEEGELEEITDEIKSGFACGKQNEVSDGVIHLRTHNIDTERNLNFDKVTKIPKDLVVQNAFGLERGDILFNNTNSTELVGKTALVTKALPYAFSNHLTRIRVNKNRVLPEWIVYVFNTLWRDKYFESICTRWVGQSGINQTALKKLKIPLPPLVEQKKIVARLDALSEKIGKIKNLQSETQNGLSFLEQSILSKSFSG